MSWKAVNGYILAKEAEQETETESGIIIPETVNQQASSLYTAIVVDEEIGLLEEGQNFLVNPRVAQNAQSIALGGEEFKQFNKGNVLLVEE